jgi:K+/H+ antiporter YhaU regulatory subunit KhtT
LALRGESGVSEKLTEWYELGARLNQVRVLDDSSFASKTLAQSLIGEDLGLSVLVILRDTHRIWSPGAQETILAGDRLIVVGRRERVEELLKHGTRMESELTFDRETLTENGAVFEVVPSPRSLAVGRTLKELRFREQFGATVLALWHGGRSVRTDQATLPLHQGDSMLVYGPSRSIQRLRLDPDYIVLHVPPESERPLRGDRAWGAVAITAIALIVSAFDILPVAEAMLGGAVAMVLTGCLRMEEAYRAVDWRANF